MPSPHRRLRPDCDGAFAGVVLVAANILGICVVGGQFTGLQPAGVAVARGCEPIQDYKRADPSVAVKGGFSP
ncbi:hypothetical protein GL263_15770 [Streptomyces durbertensis]|uniref:Uncharacterized protein n=1 Tax=Streptomyces durbertensis TaxID=2448886 RepID=A0ABR6EI81_9ACTN|nr:hypothetical protein [Streptomyces durbertensis]MBB1245015.1 hypothetical protein [Streptomyces durbertensis]